MLGKERYEFDSRRSAKGRPSTGVGTLQKLRAHASVSAKNVENSFDQLTAELAVS